MEDAARAPAMRGASAAPAVLGAAESSLVELDRLRPGHPAPRSHLAEGTHVALVAAVEDDRRLGRLPNQPMRLQRAQVRLLLPPRDVVGVDLLPDAAVVAAHDRKVGARRLEKPRPTLELAAIGRRQLDCHGSPGRAREALHTVAGSSADLGHVAMQKACCQRRVHGLRRAIRDCVHDPPHRCGAVDGREALHKGERRDGEKRDE
eukprot:4966305-Prymnesium_polylepis.1